MAGSHIAIPSILKVGKGTLNNLGKYLKSSDMKNAVIYFGNGLIELFGDGVMQSLKDEGITVVEYRELDSIRIEDIIDLAFSIDVKAQVIVGIGGGKVIDAAKYAAYLRKLPFISVPTSASSDGFSSASASLLVNESTAFSEARNASFSSNSESDAIPVVSVSSSVDITRRSPGFNFEPSGAFQMHFFEKYWSDKNRPRPEISMLSAPVLRISTQVGASAVWSCAAISLITTPCKRPVSSAPDSLHPPARRVVDKRIIGRLEFIN